MDKEIWKDIKDYEGMYQVSNLGRVRSLDKIVNGSNQYGAHFIKIRRGKLLKLHISNNGYYRVILVSDNKNKNFLIHRLVAKAFIPNPNNLPEINHIDGNKSNNIIDNLEWCNHSYNIQHRINVLGIKMKTEHLQRYRNNQKRKINQYDKQGNFIKQWNCINDITKKLKIPHSNITACCKGRLNTAHGYKWEYTNK